MSEYETKRSVALRQAVLMAVIILTASPDLTLASDSHHYGYSTPYYGHYGGHNSYNYNRHYGDHDGPHKYSNSGRHYNHHGGYYKRHGHYGSSHRRYRGHH